MLQWLKFIITKKEDPIKKLQVLNSARVYFILFFILAGILPKNSAAQIDDVGLWTGATLQKQITRKLEGSFEEQLRLNHDVTTINLLLSDIGVAYSVTKKFKAGFHYRFINSNQGNYYSKRHRFYVDVSYKEKAGSFSFTLRERIQNQLTDYNSSETGKIPVWVLRSKLTAKIDLDKKYSPYLSGEIYYLLDDPKQRSGITRYRYELGVDYEFNRVHSINPFILYQHAPSLQFDQLIYGLMYTYSL
jgi:hypothetical protein